MALGTQNNYNSNGGNNKSQNNVNVYSAYNTSNVEGIDPSAIKFTFCLNMLKIGISPKKPGDQIAFDHEKAIECFLTHTKAAMLIEEIKYMLEHKGEVHSVAVTTGKDGMVEFNDGVAFGLDHPVLVLRKLGEDGKPISNYAYEFKYNYHFSIREYNPDNPADFTKQMHDGLEVQEFLTLLTEYTKASTGAYAYYTLENAKYSQSRTDGKINAIMDKLGIEYNKGYGGANYTKSNNSFFSNNQGNTPTYKQGSLDDFAAMNTPEED